MPIEILMPALSPTMEEGTLSKWHVKPGDEVSSGDVLAEIETDKATMEIEAVEEGRLAKILIPDGTEGVQVNTPIALLLEEDEDDSALAGYQPASSSAPTPAPAPTEPPASTAQPPQAAPTPQPAQAPQAAHTPAQANGRIKASPLARRLAKEAGLDLARITGTGPNGRIVKADIEAASTSGTVASSTAQTSPREIQSQAETTAVGALKGGQSEYLTQMGIAPDSYDLVPINNIQKIVATRLSASNLNVPEFPLSVDCRIDDLLALRKQLNSNTPEGVKISVNDMLIRACALALKKVPKANASYSPDGIALHHHADVAVAVAIEDGLITPIVRAAENKGLAEISIEMQDLASRARERKLKPQEFQGGTFSISNLGMFGIRSFGSIINEPQSMILSVGAGQASPVVIDGELGVATMMTVTLTCDHRVVDGALGAQWLNAFKGLVEQPITMML